MTSFEPVQAGPYLLPSDPPDLANISKAVVDWAAPRGNMRFASTAARDAAIPSPVEGMECVTGTGAAMVKWLYFNAAWFNITVCPWTAWTPTITGLTVGNGSVAGRYLKVGRTLQLELNITWGSTTTITGPLSTVLPLGLTATAEFDILLRIYSGTANLTLLGLVRIPSTAAILLYGPTSSTNGAITAITTTMGQGTGSALSFSGTVETTT